MKRWIAAMITLMMLFTITLPALAEDGLAGITRPAEDFTVPENLMVDWNGSTADSQVKHKSYEEYVAILTQLAATYPAYCKLYSIGHTAQERQLWCLEITNAASTAEKTGIGVFGNIHGGEMESAESAMYTGWWMLVNSDSDYMQYMLNNYVVYCVPMINPDGMEQSFTFNLRYNTSARDADGDGIVFSDPYTDVDGDGFIANVYMGASGADANNLSVKGGKLTDGTNTMTSLGMESPDWNLDGLMGNDPVSSGVDMNRTFDYFFGKYDITTYNPKGISFSGYEDSSDLGNNAWSTNGQTNGPAAELEIAALQRFMEKTPMNALVTLHTGIQTVLWPWCYKEADLEADATLAQMAVIGKAMSQAFAATASSDGVTRNSYYKSSWSDYPTSAEMIDYAYGRLGIHAYTIEVYDSGDSDVNATAGDGVYENYDGTVSTGCTWQNGAQIEAFAQNTITEYTYQQVIGTGDGCLGFSAAQAEAMGLKEGMSLYFRTTERAKMSGICPTDMNLMVAAAKDAILTMIEAEPYGEGYTLPDYLK